MKKATPLSLVLLMHELEKLHEDRFFGTVEIVMQDGEFISNYQRKNRPAWEVAAEVYKATEDATLKDRLKAKFEKDGKFKSAAGIP